jgi:sialidase-1
MFDQPKAGKVVHDIFPDKDNPRNSEGAFITLKDGRIMFIYSRFKGDGFYDVASADLEAIFSSDKGETWSGSRMVVSRKEDNALNIMSVTLMRMLNGDIGLYYLVRAGGNDIRTHLRRSSDEGRTWSAAELCIQPQGYYVVNNDRVIRLSDNRLVIPSAFHRNGIQIMDKNPGIRWDGRGEVIFFLSDDDGNTWREGDCKSVLPYNMHSVSGLQEPGVVELKNGVLWAFARTDMCFQYEMFSFDRGESWTAPQPSRFTSPCSPMSMKRIPGTCSLLAVWNPVPYYNGIVQFSSWVDNGGRTPYVLSVSKDDGITWGDLKVLENEPEYGYCYCAIHFTGDSVLLGYCAGGPEDKAILSKLRIRKIKLSEIQ